MFPLPRAKKSKFRSTNKSRNIIIPKKINTDLNLTLNSLISIKNHIVNAIKGHK